MTTETITDSPKKHTNGKAPSKVSPPEYSLAHVPINTLHSSPTQPRKAFTGIEELSVDIRRNGILSPLIVRASPSHGYEVVDGERRWRASKLAGLTHLPVSVRELTDAQVLEIQLVSVGSRVDLHPLEEADAFRQLHDVHGYTHEIIAAKVAKSVSTVASRMKLCALCDEARAAFIGGALTIATAQLVAALPPEVQASATTKITQPDYNGELPTPLRAAGIIEREFTLALADAPFDTADAQLVPAAGACGSCSKRSLAQGQLFGVDAEYDLCLDRACHAVKLAEHWTRVKEDAKKRRLPVLEGKKAEKALAYGSDYVRLDSADYNDPTHTKFRDKVKRLEAEVPVTVVKDDRGAPVELVRRADLEKAGMVAKGGTKKSPLVAAEDKALREKAKAEKNKAHDDIVQLRAKVATVGNAKQELVFARLLVRGIIAQVWNDHIKRVCADRDVAPIKKEYTQDHAAALSKYADTLTVEELRELAVELVCCADGVRKAFVAAYLG
jgi:ParB/RepB/Spo0J family partition protein